MSKEEKPKEKNEAIKAFVDINTGELFKISDTQKAIRVTAKKMKAKAGNEFTAFESFAKNGDRITTKFVRECPNAPTESCTVIVEIDKMNLDKYSKRFPILWVKEVVAIVSEGSKGISKKDADELFD